MPTRLVTLLLLLLVLPARAGRSPRPDDALVEPLASALRVALDARSDGHGLQAADAAVATALSDLQRTEGLHPLLQSQLIGRAFWLARARDLGKVRPGKIGTWTVEEPGLAREGLGREGLDLAVRVPKGYDPDESMLPLVLALPDAGETPEAHLRARWTERALLEEVLLVCPAMPAEAAEWDRVQVDGRPGGLVHVLAALRIARERLAVDPDRIFVAGRGKSVPAAVAAGNHSPHAFAGIVGRAGDAGELGPDNFATLPTLFQNGGARATAFQEAAPGNCTLQADGGEAELWTWMAERVRDPAPTEVRLTVGTPFPTRVHWLGVSPIAPAAQALARIDREAARVTIESSGVSHVTLHLSDALVDLGRPLTIACTGGEVTLAADPSLAVTLDGLVDGGSDAGRVTTVELRVPVEAPGAAIGGTVVERDADLEARLEAAAGDVEALWAVVLWCSETERLPASARALHRILRLDPDHGEARAALGHAGEPGLWFPWAAAYQRYRASQTPAEAEAKGHVLHKGLWLHPDERGFANTGWTKDWARGEWLSPGDQRRLDAGWSRQDLAWVAPEDAARMDDGLWRVQGEWLELATAERRRSRLEHMWRIPSREIVLHTTLERAVALRAQEEMARALADLRKVFGAEPALPLSVAAVHSEEQYDRLAFGAPDGRRPGTDSSRMHVVHSAYFADLWFERGEDGLSHRGMGVCLWDPLVPYGDRFGVHAARLATGLSYVDALDPSPKAVRRAERRGPAPEFPAQFRAEKRLPDWLRFGAAVYAERYFFDAATAAASESDPEADPWWARAWSLASLAERGGPRPLEEIFAFRLDPSDRDDAQKLLLEAGLLVSFLVDGGVPAVAEAHGALKRALVSGTSPATELRSLTDALGAHASALRAYASGE